MKKLITSMTRSMTLRVVFNFYTWRLTLLMLLKAFDFVEYSLFDGTWVEVARKPRQLELRTRWLDGQERIYLVEKGRIIERPNEQADGDTRP